MNEFLREMIDFLGLSVNFDYGRMKNLQKGG